MQLAQVFHDAILPINSISWDSTRELMLASSDDDTATIYKLHTDGEDAQGENYGSLKKEVTLQSKRHGVQSLNFIPGQPQLTLMATRKTPPTDLTGKPRGHSVRVWDVHENRYLRCIWVDLSSPEFWSTSLSLNGSGLFAASDHHGSVHIGHWKEEKIVVRLPPHKNSNGGAALALFHPYRTEDITQNLLVRASTRQEHLLLYELRSMTSSDRRDMAPIKNVSLKKCLKHSEKIVSLSFSPVSDLLLVGLSSGRFISVDLLHEQAEQTIISYSLPSHVLTEATSDLYMSEKVRHIPWRRRPVVDPSGTFAVSGTPVDTSIHVWRLSYPSALFGSDSSEKTGAYVGSTSPHLEGWPSCLAFHPEHFFLCSGATRVAVWQPIALEHTFQQQDMDVTS